MTSSPGVQPAQKPPQTLKRPYGAGHGGRGKKFKQSKKQKPVKEGSAEEVLAYDIRSLLAALPSIKLDNGTATPLSSVEEASLPVEGTEIEVEVVELSSTGDGLAKQKGSNHIYVVPFTVPGDVAKVKVYRHMLKEHHTLADFVSIVTPSPLRDDSRVKCQYFARCSGCQFQMLSYDEQLKHKKRIVEKAYVNFSGLKPSQVPAVLDTMGSPLQYGYRTKLTPHFDGPPGSMSRAVRKRGEKRTLEAMPDIGFMPKGRRKVMDIEDCPIGTEAVRNGLMAERARMKAEFAKYERGATILLRESTARYAKDSATAVPAVLPEGAVRVETDKYVDIKTCVTDNNAVTTEYVDDYIFTNPAGAFFQNNNSILPVFTQYIRENVLPRAPDPAQKPLKYLIDAYSGSGLFTITLAAQLPGGSVGIDIADKSIAFARRNAGLNRLADARCRFLAADAGQLFRSVAGGTYDPDETAVVLDPPRRGCDAAFLRQLLAFAPRRVVYVSCNVHTQARDVGLLVRGRSGEEEEEEGGDGVQELRVVVSAPTGGGGGRGGALGETGVGLLVDVRRIPERARRRGRRRRWHPQGFRLHEHGRAAPEHLDRGGDPGHGLRLWRRSGRGDAAHAAAAAGIVPHTAPDAQRQDGRRGVAQSRARRAAAGAGGGRRRTPAAPPPVDARGDDSGGVLGQSWRGQGEPRSSSSSATTHDAAAAGTCCS